MILTTIIDRYLLKDFARNLTLALTVAVALFLAVEMFEKIDTFFDSEGSLYLFVLYLALKIPGLIYMTLPVAVMVGAIMTFAMLVKNSELIAMRAGGLSLAKLFRPVLFAGLACCVVAFVLAEFIAPVANDRADQIYNFDIKGKHLKNAGKEKGGWWKEDGRFNAFRLVDSRADKIYQLSQFELSPEFKPTVRIDAESAKKISSELGWSMQNVKRYDFTEGDVISKQYTNLPVSIKQDPSQLRVSVVDPENLTFLQLRKLIKRLRRSGGDVSALLPELYAKLSFPLISFIVLLISLPFAIRTARHSNILYGALSGILIGFSYYVVHGLSMAFGQAGLINPFLSAWFANIIMASCGALLIWGAEAP